MRTNLENSLIYDARFVTGRHASLTSVLTGTVVLDSRSPSVLALSANGVDKSIYLPLLSEERQYVIGNIGASGNLLVYNNGGVLQDTIPPGYIYHFFSTTTQWMFWGVFNGAADPTGVTTELRVVTTAGAQVVSSTEAGLLINKAVASVTPITLPLTSARAGKPVRLVDYAGTNSIATPMTITPAGTEKIMNQAAWELSSPGALTLFPQPGLGGWTIE